MRRKAGTANILCNSCSLGNVAPICGEFTTQGAVVRHRHGDFSLHQASIQTDGVCLVASCAHVPIHVGMGDRHYDFSENLKLGSFVEALGVCTREICAMESENVVHFFALSRA
jgi:hypothetical protein